MPGDAGDDGQEDDRRDDHLDQLDEAVAERLQRLARRRREMAEQYTDHDRDQHLDVEMAVPGLAGWRVGGGGRGKHFAD